MVGAASSSDHFDGVALLEDDHGLLPGGRQAGGVAAPAHLLLHAQRVDAQHLDLEELLHRLADLDLVGFGGHAEVVRVAARAVVGALLRQERLADHAVELGQRGHAAPAVSGVALVVFCTRAASASSASCSVTISVACSTSSAETSPAVRTCTPGKLRADFQNDSLRAPSTNSTRRGSPMSASSLRTLFDEGLSSLGSSVSTTSSSL